MSRERTWLLPAVSVATIVLAVVAAVVFVLAQTAPPRPDATAGPTALTASPQVRQPYVCWDGRGADSLVTCSDPRGPEGLAWVFPDKAKADPLGSCATQDTSPRDLLVECSLTWHGKQLYLRYGYWGRWTDGRDRYDAAGATPLVRQRSDGSSWLYWRPRLLPMVHGQPTWRTAQMISGKGWTFAAYAPDQALAEQALGTFGRIRDLREWRGLPR